MHALHAPLRRHPAYSPRSIPTMIDMHMQIAHQEGAIAGLETLLAVFNDFLSNIFMPRWPPTPCSRRFAWKLFGSNMLDVEGSSRHC